MRPSPPPESSLDQQRNQEAWLNFKKLTSWGHGIEAQSARDIGIFSQSLGPLGIKLLSQCCLPKLQILSLSQVEMGSDGIKYLCRGNFPKLQELLLGSNRIGNVGARHLANSNWPRLTILGISDNDIQDTGTKDMVMSNWPQLENLYLSTNIIRDAGVLNLLASNYSLRRIFLKIKRSDNEPKSTIIRRKLTKLMPNRFARMKEWDVSL